MAQDIHEHKISCVYAVGGAEVEGAAGGTGARAAPSFTRSFNSLLGLKKGIFLAGTSTRAPVLGLRPTRGLRCRVRKLPKPRISILSPDRRERTTLSKIVSTMISLSLRVNSAKRETSSIKSALVMAFIPPEIGLRVKNRFTYSKIGPSPPPMAPAVLRIIGSF